jgi:hypothetical protein
MFSASEKTARSRLAVYGKDGSVEHLFALIDLCKMIDRHKKSIPRDPSDQTVGEYQ